MSGFIKGRLQRIDDHLLRHYIEPGKIAGCQVLVARHGTVELQREFGFADLERKRPLASDTIFRIMSMTKPVTAVALMALFEEGRFRLGDPVARFLTGWDEARVWVSGRGADMQTRPARRLVTIRDLLSHTGGLTYGNTLRGLDIPKSTHPVDEAYEASGVSLQADQSLMEFAARAGRVPLRYEPGESWMYSISSDVCGALVEAISGLPFDQFLAARIFEPLGMTDTGFCVRRDKVACFAACYRRNRDKQLVVSDAPETSSYLQEPEFKSGGGGLVGTTADYFRFCEMLRRGGELDGARILSPRTVSLMSMNHLAAGADISAVAGDLLQEAGNQGVGYGLGFATTIDAVAAGVLGAGDIYWAGAASTLFWVDQGAGLVVIFMTQLTPARHFDFRGQLRALVYSSLAD